MWFTGDRQKHIKVRRRGASECSSNISNSTASTSAILSEAVAAAPRQRGRPAKAAAVGTLEQISEQEQQQTQEQQEQHIAVPAPIAQQRAAPLTDQRQAVRLLRRRLVERSSAEAQPVLLRPTLQVVHDELLDILDKTASEGTSASILLVGEHGVGKTLVRSTAWGLHAWRKI